MYHASSRENQLIYATTQSGWNVAAAIEALRGLNVGTSAGGTSTIPATDDDDGVLLLRAMLPEVSTDVLCEMYEQSGHRQAANPRNKTCSVGGFRLRSSTFGRFASLELAVAAD
jgi:hypothetical protein